MKIELNDSGVSEDSQLKYKVIFSWSPSWLLKLSNVVITVCVSLFNVSEFKGNIIEHVIN